MPQDLNNAAFHRADLRVRDWLGNKPNPSGFVNTEGGLIIPEGKSIDVSAEEGKHSAAPTAAGTPRGDESPRTTATGREFQERLAKLEGDNGVELPPRVPLNHVVEPGPINPPVAPAPVNPPVGWYDWAVGNNLTDTQQGTRYFVLWSGLIVVGVVGALLYSNYYGADTATGASTLEKAPSAHVESVVKDVSVESVGPLERLELLKDMARAKMEAFKGGFFEKVNVVKELPSKAAVAAKSLVEYLRGAGVETWTKIATAITGISSALKSWFGSKAPGLASEISKLVGGQQTLGQTIKGLGMSVAKNTAVLARSLATEASKLSLMAKTSLDKLSKAASDKALSAWNAAKGVAEKLGVGGAAAAAASAASRAKDTSLEALGIDLD